MRKRVIWYLALIALMTAAGVAIFQLRPTAGIGAVAFMASDIAVAMDQVIRPATVNRLWGLPVYYLSQILIAWSV